MNHSNYTMNELVTIFKERSNTDKLFHDAGADALDLSVVSFKTISEVVSFCSMFEGAELSGSRLYQYKDDYYLIVALDGMPRAFVRQFCLLTNEFSNKYAYGDMRASMIIEHGLLVCDDACYLIRREANIYKL